MRELTRREKREYNLLAMGSKQMSVYDFIDNKEAEDKQQEDHSMMDGFCDSDGEFEQMSLMDLLDDEGNK